MTSVSPGPVVMPNPGPAKTIGVLNIVFAAALMLCGLYSLASAIFMPWMAKMSNVQAAQLKAKAQAEQDARIASDRADLDARAASAQTDEAKAEIAAERVQLDAAAKKAPFVPNVAAGFNIAGEPAMYAFTIGDSISGLLLNVGMLASGIGLIRLRDWGRRLGVAVAGLKIARALTLLVVVLVVVVPRLATATDRMFQEMGAQMAPANPRGAKAMKDVSRVATIAMAATYSGTYSAALIYPIVTLVVLTRPRVRAACLDQPKPEPDLLA